jgi:hypothetical protein
MNKIHVWITKNGKVKETNKINSEFKTYIGFYFTDGFNLVTPVSEYNKLLAEAKKVVS